MPATIQLTKPIQAHGKTVTELTLQEPRGKDIAKCGLPRTVIFHGEVASVEADSVAIHKYIVALGNIPPSSADALSAPDWMEAMSAILGFFSPAEPTVPAGPAPETTRPDGIALPFQGTST